MSAEPIVPLRSAQRAFDRSPGVCRLTMTWRDVSGVAEMSRAIDLPPGIVVEPSRHTFLFSPATGLPHASESNIELATTEGRVTPRCLIVAATGRLRVREGRCKAARNAAASAPTAARSSRRGRRSALCRRPPHPSMRRVRVATTRGVGNSRGETFVEVLFGISIALLAAAGAASTAAQLTRIARFVDQQIRAVEIGTNAVESLLMMSETNPGQSATIHCTQVKAALAPWREAAAATLPGGEVRLTAGQDAAVLTVLWRSDAAAWMRSHLGCDNDKGIVSDIESRPKPRSAAACLHLALGVTGLDDG
ncbi:hypothetical protein [Chitinasiproducens palmae]|nr:hypothetical protein [Chitinasiproducens palmae]